MISGTNPAPAPLVIGPIRFTLSGITSAFLQIYRLAVLVAIVWLVREHHVRLRVQGDRPITAQEVRAFLPDTHKLVPDGGPRAGLFVLNAAGDTIGYAARTMPQCRDVIGYSGPTDGLIVFGPDEKVVGVAIRSSYDTPSHVEDVKFDYLFMENWNGKTWEEIAAIEDLNAAGIYGVSGATRTSEALGESISVRLASGDASAPAAARAGWRFGWKDAGLVLVVAGGLLMAFVKRRAVQRLRPWYSVAVFLYLGLLTGDLLAESLLVGWAESGIPWRYSPGVVLLAAAAFLVPLGTRQPLYCQYICPHGHAQRWLMKVLPARWMLKLPKDVKWPAQAIPLMLLVVVLLVTFLDLPLDLAGIEPFDAYVIRSAGVATIAVAAVGLFAALFIPMAYCKYGCPTGLLLDFVRRRTGETRPGLRDLVALLFLGAAFVFYRYYDLIHGWIVQA